MLSDCEQNHSMAWAPRLTTRIGEGESELRASLFLSLLPGCCDCRRVPPHPAREVILFFSFCNRSNFGILDYHLHGVERNPFLAGFSKVAV